jgi:hypothetical protein
MDDLKLVACETMASGLATNKLRFCSLLRPDSWKKRLIPIELSSLRLSSPTTDKSSAVSMTAEGRRGRMTSNALGLELSPSGLAAVRWLNMKSPPREPFIDFHTLCFPPGAIAPETATPETAVPRAAAPEAAAGLDPASWLDS